MIVIEAIAVIALISATTTKGVFTEPSNADDAAGGASDLAQPRNCQRFLTSELFAT